MQLLRQYPLPDEARKREYTARFEELLKNERGKHEYDVIMAYSGGKDSTYTMYLLSHNYGLKILAYTFDNGFISREALSNITRMCDVMEAPV